MSDRIVITPEEVAAAEPAAAARRAQPVRGEPTRARSQVPLAAFVLALIGIPLGGFVVGPIAIVVGVLALTADLHDEQRGHRLAVAGVVIGTIDFVGWLAVLWVVLGRPSSPVSPALAVPGPEGMPPPSIADVEAATPPVRRALLANLHIAGSRGTGPSWSGSGVVVGRADGKILALTNAHVLGAGGDPLGGATLRAAGTRGALGPVEIVWVAPDGIDLAVVSVTETVGVEVVPLDGGARALIGETAFVVGNPLDYRASYTAGVISSVRTTRIGGQDLRVYQAQTAINPGNSGGGLYTSDGRLIGLSTWTTSKSTSEGIGFAISVESIVELIGRVSAPWVDTVLPDREHE